MTHASPNIRQAVIDTNVLLDWLVFGEPAALALARAVQSQEWTWHTTPAMLGELRHVLAQPLPEKWRTAQQLALTIELGGLATLYPAPISTTPASPMACRDATDQMFIDLALSLSPCWLVTRDRALLALRRRATARGVTIATPELWHQAQPLDPSAAPMAAA